MSAVESLAPIYHGRFRVRLESFRVNMTHTFEQKLKLLDKAEAGFRDGQSRSEICERLQVTEEQLALWVDRYSRHPNMTEHLNNSHLLAAVSPVFYKDGEQPELAQVGSGVLLRIGPEVFLLTAAHVTDYSKTGTLYIPFADGISPIFGELVFNNLRGNATSREDDKADIGYYKLAEKLREKLDPSLQPIAVNDLLLTNDLEEGDLFTFVGFPWRKTKRSGNNYEGEQTTFSGHAMPKDKYDKLGYSNSENIVIRLRRKKTFSTRYQSVQIAPHPQGISGGAIISWPRSLVERATNPTLKLAGIGHTYNKDNNIMAGTRVIPYLDEIRRSNPRLQEFLGDKNSFEK